MSVKNIKAPLIATRRSTFFFAFSIALPNSKREISFQRIVFALRKAFFDEHSLSSKWMAACIWLSYSPYLATCLPALPLPGGRQPPRSHLCYSLYSSYISDIYNGHLMDYIFYALNSAEKKADGVKKSAWLLAPVQLLWGPPSTPEHRACFNGRLI